MICFVLKFIGGKGSQKRLEPNFHILPEGKIFHIAAAFCESDDQCHRCDGVIQSLGPTKRHEPGAVLKHYTSF